MAHRASRGGAEPPHHRVHVLRWLRRLGGVFMRNWLAVTIGSHIFAWRAMTASELEHELEHVRQWRRFGVKFALIYPLESIRQLVAGRRFYHDNRFEAAAREAAARVRSR